MLLRVCVTQQDIAATVNWKMKFDLMSHVYAKLHIRPSVKYVANSGVCVAVRLCYTTTNPRFDFVNSNFDIS